MGCACCLRTPTSDGPAVGLDSGNPTPPLAETAWVRKSLADRPAREGLPELDFDFPRSGRREFRGDNQQHAVLELG